MNLLVILVGVFLAAYSVIGLAWSRRGDKKPYDEVIGRGGVSLKLRALQIRVAIVLVVGLLIVFVGFMTPPWP